MSGFKRGSVLALAAVSSIALAAPSLGLARRPFIDRLPTIATVASTVPTNGPAMGDQNPYGVAVVPHSRGDLVRGDVLVSNFNNAANQQGTGSSIVEISPSGKFRVFSVVPQPTAAPAVGLTTALVALKSGFVIVGSLPAPRGDSANAQAGALTILDSHGHVVENLVGGHINGPWDMAAVDHGKQVTLFVTNVLNGTVAAKGGDVDMGTVVRITLRISHGVPKETSDKVIATGFREHTDPNALVVGPTGVGLGEHGTLYVADTARNRIAAIPDALTRTSILGGGGRTVSVGGNLLSPLGLVIAPGDDIVNANGGDGNVVETSPAGAQVQTKTLVANGAGDLFGLAVRPDGEGLYFVNDAGSGPAANSLQVAQR
jgi:sugar lactone lactonase YvrE